MTLSPFLHPFAKPTATDFITIVRGEGAAVFDDTGKRYVDGLASLWYCNVGHGTTGDHRSGDPPDGGAGELQHVRHLHEPAGRGVAALVSALSPMPDARVFLTGSGSEAVDTALKLARLTFSRLGQPSARSWSVASWPTTG